MNLRVIAGAGAVLLAAAFGVASATTGAGAGTRSGTLHLISTSFSINSTTQPVMVLGPINAKGTDHQIDDNHDRFQFAKGSLFVRHHASSDHDSIDKKNCVFSELETGTYTITGGSGAYAHAHGYGSYQTHFIGQGCSQNKPPVMGAVIIDASGPFTLG